MADARGVSEERLGKTVKSASTRFDQDEWEHIEKTRNSKGFENVSDAVRFLVRATMHCMRAAVDLMIRTRPEIVVVRRLERVARAMDDLETVLGADEDSQRARREPAGPLEQFGGRLARVEGAVRSVEARIRAGVPPEIGRVGADIGEVKTEVDLA